MAQKIAIELEDDLDGGPADETVRFGVDGSDYEIDLSTKNAAALRRKLAPFIDHARKAGRGARRRPGRATSGRERGGDPGRGRKIRASRSANVGAYPPTSLRSTKPLPGDPDRRWGQPRAAEPPAAGKKRTPESADVSEFRHRILMQRPASPFVISNAMRGTWLGADTHPRVGQIADSGRVTAARTPGFAARRLSILLARTRRSSERLVLPKPS